MGTVAYISNGVEHASAIQYGITDCDRDTRNHVPDKKSGRADRRDGPLWRDFTVLLLFKGSIGEVNCLKKKKSPDPPGLENGTLLVMGNALTTELWDRAEPQRR